MIVAGRSNAKAAAFCRGRSATKAQLIPAVFDRDRDIGAQLAALHPDILVDASGPFQAYGAGHYRVIEACIAQGVTYLDLADGSDFVAGVGAYDEEAQAAGISVLSGVSSFPVLTAAVVRRLSSGMASVRAIVGGIVPSPYAGVGLNVIRAIAGYAGQRVAVRRHGKAAEAWPMTEQVRFTIRPPGRLPLRSTLFSLVDVPDLRVLPQLWPDTRIIWMGAGPLPEILHRALIALAWLVRLKLLPSLSPLARLMHFASNRFTWGEHRGGMFVRVEGVDRAGAPVVRTWHLLAEGDDGPLIPSMAVEALVRKALAGNLPQPGARVSICDLELEDYEVLFARRTIETGIRDEIFAPTTPLYARILGSAWHDLPSEIRDMHAGGGTAYAVGRARVERGRGLLAWIAAALVRFPGAAADTEVTVCFDRSGEDETWTRTFGDRSFSSRQFAGRGRSEGLLCERFGNLTFAMALVLRDGCLSLVLRRWSLFGIPLPHGLCPRADAYESVDEGRFRFHIEISHALTGLIVRYQGWLRLAPREAWAGVGPGLRRGSSFSNSLR